MTGSSSATVAVLRKATICITVLLRAPLVILLAACGSSQTTATCSHTVSGCVASDENSSEPAPTGLTVETILADRERVFRVAATVCAQMELASGLTGDPIPCIDGTDAEDPTCCRCWTAALHCVGETSESWGPSLEAEPESTLVASIADALLSSSCMTERSAFRGVPAVCFQLESAGGAARDSVHAAFGEAEWLAACRAYVSDCAEGSGPSVNWEESCARQFVADADQRLRARALAAEQSAQARERDAGRRRDQCLAEPTCSRQIRATEDCFSRCSRLDLCTQSPNGGEAVCDVGIRLRCESACPPLPPIMLQEFQHPSGETRGSESPVPSDQEVCAPFEGIRISNRGSRPDFGGHGSVDLPEAPGRAMISRIMGSLMPRIEACAPGMQGVANARVSLNRDGSVASASISGVPFERTEAASCMERAIRAAVRFPPFSNDTFVFTYPFALRAR